MYLFFKCSQLGFFILPAPIEIKTTLAYCYIFKRSMRLRFQIGMQPLFHESQHVDPIILHFFGLETYHREAISGISSTDLHHRLDRFYIYSGYQNGTNTGFLRTSYGLWQVILKFFPVKMGVGINESKHIL